VSAVAAIATGTAALVLTELAVVARHHPRRSSRPAPELGDGIIVAELADGPAIWPLGVGSLLIAGTTGSGKSTVLRGLVADAAHRHDTALVALDLKGGVELGPWAPRLHGLATTQADARHLLLLVAGEVRRRHRVLRSRSATRWDAAWGPYVVIVVDEAAELLEPASTAKADRDLATDVAALTTSVARLGRASGVHLVICTQRPSADSITAALRGQLDYRVGLRVRDPAESRMVCPMAVADLTQLEQYTGVWLPPLPGQPAPCRAVWVDPAAVPAIAAELADRRPTGTVLDGLRWEPTR
jgi:DNA segregation ATPase FtsK/SpoIIIE, S-DNA-T family